MAYAVSQTQNLWSFISSQSLIDLLSMYSDYDNIVLDINITLNRYAIANNNRFRCNIISVRVTNTGLYVNYKVYDTKTSDTHLVHISSHPDPLFPGSQSHIAFAGSHNYINTRFKINNIDDIQIDIPEPYPILETIFPGRSRNFLNDMREIIYMIRGSFTDFIRSCLLAVRHYRLPPLLINTPQNLTRQQSERPLTPFERFTRPADIFRTDEDIYYNEKARIRFQKKYLKYKQKYLQLKNSLNINVV